MEAIDCFIYERPLCKEANYFMLGDVSLLQIILFFFLHMPPKIRIIDGGVNIYHTENDERCLDMNTVLKTLGYSVEMS